MKKTPKRRLFFPNSEGTPVRIEREKFSPKSRVRFGRRHFFPTRNLKKRYKRLSVPQFERSYIDLLGKSLTELCKMKLMGRVLKRQNYSPYQKFLATNLLVSGGKSGYRMLRNILTLPCTSTVLRSLERYSSSPGIRQNSGKLLKMKINPQSDKEKLCFLQIDEMSLTNGLKYDQKLGNIDGFEDDGVTKNARLASFAVCVMVAGVCSRWKYPLGYCFTRTAMNSTKIEEVLKSSIRILEREGFIVKGIVTDQASNFEKTFRIMGVKPERPFFEMEGKKYYVHRDPPHLLKNARNLLLSKKGIRIPGYSGLATWNHIETLYLEDSKSSFKVVPKLTNLHVFGLKFAAKMKVKLAANVLSHSVSAALNLYVATNRLQSAALATSSFCSWINDIFDFLNSLYFHDSVILRRPFKQSQSGLKFLEDALKWLERLKLLNSESRCRFIDGFIQSLNVVKLLSQDLRQSEIQHLSTRNLNQDYIEQFFGKIRQKGKFPTPYDFKIFYTRITVASLIRPPKAGNCELQEDTNEVTNFTCYVSCDYFI